jgi:predicted nucleotidyltransferase
MRRDLDHLPLAKRHELELVTRILFAEFEDALKGRNAPHRKAGRILKVVLFGSYARGAWVADPVGGYFSDYDVLVVVNHDQLADTMEYWRGADDRLLQEQTITGRLRTPTNFIVHSLTDVNRQLKRGRPFFVDIVRDGIALYEAEDHPFEHPQRLSADAALRKRRLPLPSGSRVPQDLQILPGTRANQVDLKKPLFSCIKPQSAVITASCWFSRSTAQRATS